jgi:deoxyadenosine/deoxycytidine kinase
MNNNYLITVVGNTGVGKSALAARLADSLGGMPLYYEAETENPYLEDLCKNLRQWSFHSQIYTLSRRFSRHRQMISYPRTVIQDRSIYEEAEVVVRGLYQCGDISERDYKVYRYLYEELLPFVRPPDLLIYLKARVPTLIERIGRSRHYLGREVSPLQLQRLNELYNAWIEDFTICPVLTLPADNLDFVRFERDFTVVRQKVMESLAERQPLTQLVRFPQLGS